MTKSLNIPVPNVDRWSDFARKALAPPPNVTAKLRSGSIEAVEAIIGHKFSRPYLLAQALVRLNFSNPAAFKLTFLRFRRTRPYRVTIQLPTSDLNSSATLSWTSVGFQSLPLFPLADLKFSGDSPHI